MRVAISPTALPGLIAMSTSHSQEALRSNREKRPGLTATGKVTRESTHGITGRTPPKLRTQPSRERPDS